ncbi:B2 protein [Capsicum chinense]|nr:B2 protein [Capsicum chinense]
MRIDQLCTKLYTSTRETRDSNIGEGQRINFMKLLGFYRLKASGTGTGFMGYGLSREVDGVAFELRGGGELRVGSGQGIWKVASFGGSNIDLSTWEDKKNPSESRFPAQHVPTINEGIPSVTKATSKHQKLLDRYLLIPPT